MFEELVSILTFKHSQDPIEQNKKGQLSQGRLHGTIFNGPPQSMTTKGSMAMERFARELGEYKISYQRCPL